MSTGDEDRGGDLERRMPSHVKWRHLAKTSVLYWFLPNRLRKAGASSVLSARLWTGPTGTAPTDEEWVQIRIRAKRLSDEASGRRIADERTVDRRDAEAAAGAQDGSVYFIRCGDSIKIGFSVNPYRRLIGLQCGNPQTLEPLALIPAKSGGEAMVQHIFRKHHVRDEWFEDAPAIRAFITEHGHPWQPVRGREKRKPGWSRKRDPKGDLKFGAAA